MRTSVSGGAGDDDPGETGAPDVAVHGVVEGGDGHGDRMTGAGAVQSVQHRQRRSSGHRPHREVGVLTTNDRNQQEYIHHYVLVVNVDVVDVGGGGFLGTRGSKPT